MKTLITIITILFSLNAVAGSRPVPGEMPLRSEAQTLVLESDLYPDISYSLASTDFNKIAFAVNAEGYGHIILRNSRLERRDRNENSSPTTVVCWRTTFLQNSISFSTRQGVVSIQVGSPTYGSLPVTAVQVMMEFQLPEGFACPEYNQPLPVENLVLINMAPYAPGALLVTPNN